MLCRQTLHKAGLTTILLVLLLALPGTAIASGGGGEGGDGGGDGVGGLKSLNRELQDIKGQKETLEREMKLLSSIDLDGEMSEFVDKKKTEARIKRLTSTIQILSSKESDLKTMIDTMTKQNWVKVFKYIRYFTIQAYLGLPPLPFEGFMFRDPLALGAFQIVVMIAAFDPVFRVYFEARYGYLFKQ